MYVGLDDDTIAESLRRNVRVLCWVMTQPENHMSRAVHVQATWGRRCNVLLFVSEKDDVGKTHPTRKLWNMSTVITTPYLKSSHVYFLNSSVKHCRFC